MLNTILQVRFPPFGKAVQYPAMDRIPVRSHQICVRWLQQRRHPFGWMV